MGNELSLSEMEGKLIAHRRLLEIVVRKIADLQENPEEFWDMLNVEAMVHDQEEDPGVEPSPAYAIEAGAAFELESLLENARGGRSSNRSG